MKIISVVFWVIIAMLEPVTSSMAQSAYITDEARNEAQAFYSSYDPFNPAMTHFYNAGAEAFTKRCKTCHCVKVGGELQRKRCANPGFPVRDCPLDHPIGTCPCTSNLPHFNFLEVIDHHLSGLLKIFNMW